MKINNLGYLIKEGIRSIFLHGFMSFAAICVTVACLLIVGSFTGLVYNVNIIVEDLNKTNEILVYIDENYDVARAKMVWTEINNVDENIYKTEFITREQALEQFIEDHDGDQALSGVQADYLRHRVRVILEENGKMRETVEAIETINGVAKVSASYELAEGFSTIQDVLQIASAVVIGVLLVVSLLIISNTVKIGMYDRRDEIAIMKMVGATNGFIRLPFVVEGFTLGMVGAGMAFAMEWGLYDSLMKRLAEEETLNKLFTLAPFEELLVPLVCTFALAGMFVGIVGSWTSIRKFLDV